MMSSSAPTINESQNGESPKSERTLRKYSCLVNIPIIFLHLCQVVQLQIIQLTRQNPQLAEAKMQSTPGDTAKKPAEARSISTGAAGKTSSQPGAPVPLGPSKHAASLWASRAESCFKPTIRRTLNSLARLISTWAAPWHFLFTRALLI